MRMSIGVGPVRFYTGGGRRRSRRPVMSRERQAAREHLEWYMSLSPEQRVDLRNLRKEQWRQIGRVVATVFVFVWRYIVCPPFLAVYWVFRSMYRFLNRKRIAAAELEQRMNFEHAQLMNGNDTVGVYGQYPPAV